MKCYKKAQIIYDIDKYVRIYKNIYKNIEEYIRKNR